MALAVRDGLRRVFRWEGGLCDVQPPPGRPPAMSGQVYVAVWEGGAENDATESRHDLHRINVTITRRVGDTPQDRMGTDAIHKEAVGLEVLADAVASAVHGDKDGYWIMNQANNYLKTANATGGTIYGFTEPLRYLSMTRVEDKTGAWFHGDRAHEMSGLAITIYFGRALRLQSITYQS